MKKYIHLIPDDPKRSSLYFRKDNNIESWLFPFFISEVSLKWVLKETEEPIDSTGCGTEWLYIQWSRKYNGVVVQLQEFYKEEHNKDDFFVMRFDNFKEMLKKWNELEGQGAPNIYFIEEPSGRILVQESLEEKEKIEKTISSKEKKYFKISAKHYWLYKLIWPVPLELKLLHLFVKGSDPEELIEKLYDKNGVIEGWRVIVKWSQRNNSVAIHSKKE